VRASRAAADRQPAGQRPVHRLEALLEDPGVDYRNSPHLAQWALRYRLVAMLQSTLRSLQSASLPLRVLELAAGHGGYTGQLLAAGCEVTAVDMSPRAEQDLRAKYAANERLRTVLDPHGSLSGVGDGYSLAVCLSVLHHVPDYLRFLERVTATLRPGGALLTLQDPLWYLRLPALTRRADRAAYLAWRVFQGDVLQGFEAMRRRMRKEYPQPAAGEIVYYHVVRNGVDEQAIATSLRESFARVDVFSYWSNHLSLARPVAELVGMRNTFGVRATGRRGGS
jgi:SAM-dependent methyltransferase